MCIITIRRVIAFLIAAAFQLQPILAQTVLDPSHSPDNQPLTLWRLIYSAGWVMIPLALASVAAVTLILFYLLTFREKNITTPEMLRRIEPYFENEDIQGLASYVSERPQATARVVDSVLKFLYRHPDAEPSAVKAVAESEGTRIASQLHQRAIYLMDVGVIAPMLGLMGTVVGILNSFGSISQEATPMRTMMLAGGVSQALVSTAAGLIIGIASMAFYAFFRGRVQYLISILETQCTLLVEEIIIMQRRHRGKRATV